MLRKSEVRSQKSEVRRPEAGTQKLTRNSTALGLKLGAFLLLFSLTVLAQKMSGTVVTIGDVKVGKEEFEANYRKNNT
jgi:hypothetical protein